MRFCFSFHHHEMQRRSRLTTSPDRVCVSSLSRLRNRARGAASLKALCKTRLCLSPLATAFSPLPTPGAQSLGRGCPSPVLPGTVGEKNHPRDRGAGCPAAAAGLRAPSARKSRRLLPKNQAPTLLVLTRERSQEGRFSPWRGNRSHDV